MLVVVVMKDGSGDGSDDGSSSDRLSNATNIAFRLDSNRIAIEFWS